MKTAVVLFNLGGPDNLEAVRPFLNNLFSDPAIIRLPAFLRKPLAWVIARARAPKARAIYQQIGGRSPILEGTQAQAKALEEMLKEKGEHKVFVSMRYWNPMSDIVAKNVNAYAPDRVILLPLYPQFSTTTTASSFDAWDVSAKGAGLTAPVTKICCYPTDNHFIAAHARLIKDVYWKASEAGKPRVLFTAHGLPERIANDGDPYPWQIKETVAAIVKVLAIDALDYTVCYQSRVGPLEWLAPSAEEEILRAGQDKVPVVVVPVSFVSEHSETLVELDIEYRQLADAQGVSGYWRVPTLSADPLFIEALANLCTTVGKEEGTHSSTGGILCPRNFEKCACLREEEQWI